MAGHQNGNCCQPVAALGIGRQRRGDNRLVADFISARRKVGLAVEGLCRRLWRLAQARACQGTPSQTLLPVNIFVPCH